MEKWDPDVHRALGRVLDVHHRTVERAPGHPEAECLCPHRTSSASGSHGGSTGRVMENSAHVPANADRSKIPHPKGILQRQGSLSISDWAHFSRAGTGREWWDFPHGRDQLRHPGQGGADSERLSHQIPISWKITPALRVDTRNIVPGRPRTTSLLQRKPARFLETNAPTS